MNRESDVKQGTLYVVATPIGNLEDITLRAIRVLKEVQLIAAEDTRRTRKLLSAYHIHTPLTSLYDHVEEKKSGVLIDRMKKGLDIAYVSDAGTPGVSDPGYVLISRAVARGIRVVPVPGVSAVVAALSVSGLPMDRFIFYGFVPARAARRRSFLSALAEETKTLVFYESPRRLLATLADIESILGDRNIVVVRELTKAFEEILRGTVRNVIGELRERKVKGEVTLVVAGKEQTVSSCSDEEIQARFEQLRSRSNLSRRDIIEKLARNMGVPKKRVYRIVINSEG
ncbi:MAG: 16S rRNA (cytidine(1402)-2'-O)-methyltransferase [Deltaproteobacteria bacterium]|nr:16S rRNA (cytidine(1402)-2'-O)-methyltransferase [Deltaproteobacteria bacterium]